VVVVVAAAIAAVVSVGGVMVVVVSLKVVLLLLLLVFVVELAVVPILGRKDGEECCSCVAEVGVMRMALLSLLSERRRREEEEEGLWIIRGHVCIFVLEKRKNRRKYDVFVFQYLAFLLPQFVALPCCCSV
jgi:hypothetical protein